MRGWPDAQPPARWIRQLAACSQPSPARCATFSRPAPGDTQVHPCCATLRRFRGFAAQAGDSCCALQWRGGVAVVASHQGRCGRHDAPVRAQPGSRLQHRTGQVVRATLAQSRTARGAGGSGLPLPARALRGRRRLPAHAGTAATAASWPARAWPSAMAPTTWP